MSDAIYDAAVAAGCSHREAQVLAVYVHSETTRDAALKLGIAEQTVKHHLTRVRLQLKAPHTAAAVAKLVEATH